MCVCIEMQRGSDAVCVCVRERDAVREWCSGERCSVEMQWGSGAVSGSDAI